MADAVFKGTAGADIVDQDRLGPLTYTHFDLGAGDDVLRLRQGSVTAGPGNDRIELVGDALSALFYDSPTGVTVDLEAGYALDGFGTRDTLVGQFFQINSTGFSDRLLGNALDNLFAPGQDTYDFVDGRGGNDRVYLYIAPQGLDFQVSVDGRRAVVTDPGRPEFKLETVDVETLYFDPVDGAPDSTLQVADLIDPLDFGRVGLTGREGQRWNAAGPVGTAVTVTYSFVESAPPSGVGSAGFQAFTGAQRAVVAQLLADTSILAGIRFEAVADSATVQMRFGTSQQAATRGVAFAPDQSGDSAGDIWMDVESMRDLSAGSEGRAALLHEIGHALGLRHPRNADPGDAWSEQWRAADDVSALSVMASQGNPAGLFRAAWGPHDVVALRHLYGTVPVHAGRDLYRIDDTAGRQLATVVDDGGIDVLDASASSIGATLDLRGGRPSSIGRTAEGQAALDNLVVAPGSVIEAAVGTPFDDVLTGNGADNRLEGGRGNDFIAGGAGLDVAVYQGAWDEHTVRRDAGDWRVEQPDEQGVDLLTGIERLVFTDRVLAIDIVGSPAHAVRLIGALFGPTRIEDAGIVGIGIQLFDAGLSLAEVAALALGSDFFAQSAGGRDHASIVRQLYTNVVGQAPGPADQAAFVGLLDSGAMTPVQLAVLAATHPLNDLAIDLVGLAESGIAFLPG